MDKESVPEEKKNPPPRHIEILNSIWNDVVIVVLGSIDIFESCFYQRVHTLKLLDVVGN